MDTIHKILFWRPFDNIYVGLSFAVLVFVIAYGVRHLSRKLTLAELEDDMKFEFSKLSKDMQKRVLDRLYMHDEESKEKERDIDTYIEEEKLLIRLDGDWRAYSMGEELISAITAEKVHSLYINDET